MTDVTPVNARRGNAVDGAVHPDRQNAHLTFRHNVLHGRHGWLRLTPAYSVKVVGQILAEFGALARTVIDPFSGTGTTALSAAYSGMRAVATDINPFLVWLGRVKSTSYNHSDTIRFTRTSHRIMGRVRGGSATATALPPIKNIERWWGASELDFLASARGEIRRVPSGPVRDLLDVAFCRTLIATSNAAFNHQSMSFREPAQRTRRSRRALARCIDQFLADVQTIAATLGDNPRGTTRYMETDARTLTGIGDGAFDLLITSPPFANRMSYIRELRPYLYWLGYLREAREAGELDWQAIGGTWGVATSRLAAWRPGNGVVPDYVAPILENIRRSHPKNGELMAVYVQKYCQDMFAHFQAAARDERQLLLQVNDNYFCRSSPGRWTTPRPG